MRSSEKRPSRVRLVKTNSGPARCWLDECSLSGIVQMRLRFNRNCSGAHHLLYMNRTAIKPNNPRLFEEAREAIIKLTTLSRVLTHAELETLELLFDKRALAIISKSLDEAERGKYEPIATIR